MTGYVILENMDDGPISPDSNMEFLCFAKSIKEADKIIRNEVKEYFNPDSMDEDFTDWCSHFLVCQIFGETKPIPSITIKVKLETI